MLFLTQRILRFRYEQVKQGKLAKRWRRGSSGRVFVVTALYATLSLGVTVRQLLHLGCCCRRARLDAKRLFVPDGAAFDAVSA
jgi:hypothetical protein